MNNEKKISASIMCADLLNLQRDIELLEKSNIEYLHLDIMDGTFVPNITLGFDVCNAIGEMSKIKRDIHLLMENPAIFIDRMNLKKTRCCLYIMRWIVIYICSRNWFVQKGLDLVLRLIQKRQ